MTKTDLDQTIDQHVGRLLRARRRLLGLSQPQLAEAVGVRFQQIQKYECGEDRVSASRLWRLSAALKSPVDYFFEGLESSRLGPRRACAEWDESQTQGQAFDLARSYQQLPEQPRRVLLDLARSLAGDPRPD